MNKPKILMSMHSQRCEKIFNGENKIEMRETAPNFDTPFEALVYCTKGKPYLYKNPNNGELFLDSNIGYRGGDYEDRYLTGKVIGSFMCNKILLSGYIYHCNNGQIVDHDKGKPLYSWYITEPKLFDKPRQLWEYRTICKHMAGDKACYDCPYLVTNDDGLNGTSFYGGKYVSCDVYYSKPVTRAPRSWMYIK
jgi:hypothetical protein